MGREGEEGIPIVKRVLTTTVIANYMYVWMNNNMYVCMYILGYAEKYDISNCEAFRDTWRHANNKKKQQKLTGNDNWKIFFLIF